MRRRTLGAGLACLALLLVLASAASAHPALQQASPTPGLIAPAPAAAVELSFSEPAVREGSRITVTVDGRQVHVGAVRSSDGGRLLSVRPARALGTGVYEVSWTALGADGHRGSGRFGFGVADRDGEAPAGGQALLAFGSRGGPGDQSAATEGVLAVVARWLGLLCASVLLGGFALLLLARRRAALAPAAHDTARRRWRLLGTPTWLLMLLAAIEGALANATAGAGGGLNIEALLASPTGQGATIVLAVLLAGSVALAALRQRPARELVWAGGALVVVLGQALTGHVQTLRGADRAVGAGLQIVHALSAALWLGGLLVLAAVSIRPEAGRPSPLRPLVRAFSPLAGATFGLAVLTGVLAAVREVDRLHFLRWSTYGNVVLIKAALVALAAIAGAVTLLRMRRGAPRSGLLRAEALIVVLVLGLAATLTGLVPGRGQALPAQSGTLLPGPALASAIADGGPLRVSLSPARSGRNVLSVLQESPLGQPPARARRSVRAELFCNCPARAVRVSLTRGPGGVWSAPVDIAGEGGWFARLTVDGRASAPIALPVGVPSARGPGPITVLTVADLSGRGARRCRSHLLGLELAVARLNALGGLDGGRKVALLGLDDGGSPARAGRLAAGALSRSAPIAMAAPCGPAAAAAVSAAAAAGVPAIVADPAVTLVAARNTFRLAADPYAEGFADGQYIRSVVQPSAASRLVRAVRTGDPDNARRIAGLREGLRGTRFEVRELDVRRLADGPAALQALLDRGSAAAVLLDGDPAVLAAQLARLGRTRLGFAPGVVLASTAVLSERFVSDSGAIGRIGAIQGPIEVVPDSATALAYARTLPSVFPGELPTLDGLRGYNAGLALAEGVRSGIDRRRIAAELLAPAPFSDALMTPWRADAPAAGNQRFSFVRGNFLPPTLIPQSAGGESFNGTYFPDGTWARLTTTPAGPPFEHPVHPLT
ncbi:MAG: copper transport protein [Miltoncostaeaceae bacterium]|nr:copper transport protein [Miltoncostaeaceae bacterium]